MSEIGLDVGLANELKLAFRRHDYTLEQVQRLKGGDILGLVWGVLIGTHRIVEIEKPAVPLLPPLFRFIDTVDIPATDRFEIDRIKIGEVDGVKVGYVDPFFTSCFGGLVEEAQAALTLRRNELTRTASCSAINEALGSGVEEATMSQVWALMKRQGKGQKKGFLHVDGKANLFRVRAKGLLRLVCVDWNADYGDWGVFAYEVDDGYGWHAGRLVFSRNS